MPASVSQSIRPMGPNLSLPSRAKGVSAVAELGARYSLPALCGCECDNGARDPRLTLWIEPLTNFSLRAYLSWSVDSAVVIEFGTVGESGMENE